MKLAMAIALALLWASTASAHYNFRVGGDIQPPTSDWACASEVAPCPDSHPYPHEDLLYLWRQDSEGNYAPRAELMEPEWYNMITASKKRRIEDYTLNAVSRTAGAFLFPDIGERLLVFVGNDQCGRGE